MKNYPNQGQRLDHAICIAFLLLSAALPVLALAQIGGVS